MSESIFFLQIIWIQILTQHIEGVLEIVVHLTRRVQLKQWSNFPVWIFPSGLIVKYHRSIGCHNLEYTCCNFLCHRETDLSEFFNPWPWHVILNDNILHACYDSKHSTITLCGVSITSLCDVSTTSITPSYLCDVVCTHHACVPCTA